MALKKPFSYFPTMPGGTTTNRLHWIYVLESQRDYQRYIGYTVRVQERLKEHREGKVMSTKNRRPFRLIYLEACISEEDARRREGYLKTTDGRRFLAKRLKSFYIKKGK